MHRVQFVKSGYLSTVMGEQLLREQKPGLNVVARSIFHGCEGGFFCYQWPSSLEIALLNEEVR